MFRIKICGVTLADDVRCIAEAGADAIGLNFYPQSKRFLPADHLLEVANTIPTTVSRVGVFVNPTNDDLQQILTLTKLDYVQLHGDESPKRIAELVATFPALKDRLIKAFRLQKPAHQLIDPFLAECDERDIELAAMLIDAWHADEYGGTGQTADWAGLKEWIASQQIPVILAGGLTPTNVAAAIDAVRPYGVDTASGVEKSPGCKDHAFVKSFVAETRQALSNNQK